MVFQIRIRGADDVIGTFRNMELTAPKEFDFIARELAEDVRKGTIRNLAKRTRRRTGMTERSIKSIKLQSTKGNVQYMVTSLPPVGDTYFGRLEHGQIVHGWHFVPGQGGRIGEGTSRPGGQILIGTGRFSPQFRPYSMRDATESTRRRAKQIAERAIDKWIQGMERKVTRL